MSDAKATNIDYFRANVAEWLKDEKLRNKFVVIDSQTIRGSFDTFDAALRDAVARFPSADFVIQQIIDESEIINFIRAAG